MAANAIRVEAMSSPVLTTGAAAPPVPAFSTGRIADLVPWTVPAVRSPAIKETAGGMSVAAPVLAHRVLVRADAASRGLTAEQAIDEVLAAVPVPAGR